ncbi:Uncharacterised protein [Mycobacteroides abscessus subsp. abscessus]|uniref:hypothetical protein n=1 Tax=Mycobacteroides abscessus TaxID=36809 RepID=UPI0009274A12|nr:hypothetical protein [Mycobacteroides abscessus]SIH25837.1 Uncharacterised protein [Mycobacteroides abscessus subsp. abscessus]
MSEAAWLAARFRGICAELLRRARDLGVNVRAGQIWSTLAELCAAVADALDSDPTLRTEPPETSRFREVYLLEELLRHLNVLISKALQADVAPDRRAGWWSIAESVYTRAVEVATCIPVTVPRADHGTVEGSMAISEERLAAHHGLLEQAVALIRRSVASARDVEHPSARVDELLLLAQGLQGHVEQLDAVASRMWGRGGGESVGLR